MLLFFMIERGSEEAFLLIRQEAFFMVKNHAPK
jgi:hypothetical protein